MGAGKALSLDLRVRAVEAYENGEGTLQEIADRFCIGRTSLCNLLRLQRLTGSLEPRPERGRPARKVDDEGRARIRALVAERPDATIEELLEAYNAVTVPTVSEATLGREVRAMKLTRKKRRSGPPSATRQHSRPDGSGS